MGAMKSLIGSVEDKSCSIEQLVEDEQMRLRTLNYGRVLMKISMDAVSKSLKCVSSISLLYEREDSCIAKIYDHNEIDSVELSSWLGSTVVDINAGCALWFRNATSTTAIVWTAYGVGALPKEAIRDVYLQHFGYSVAGTRLLAIDPAWLVEFVKQDKYILAMDDALSEQGDQPETVFGLQTDVGQC